LLAKVEAANDINLNEFDSYLLLHLNGDHDHAALLVG
jgi:hypothetical protein